MAASTAAEPTVRLLGLGNPILADDALGLLVAGEVRRRARHPIDVVTSSEAGFNLIDKLLGAGRLLVVETVQTGAAKPGTIEIFDEEHANPVPGCSPHCVGLFEVVALARELGLPAPRRITIIAVEAADCSTVGGPMHSDVSAAIPKVVDWVEHFIEAGDA